MAKKLTPPCLINYPAEIEARRAAYTEVAEGLIKLAWAQHAPSPSALDVQSPEWGDPEPENHILWHAMEEHLRALYENVLTVRDDDFMRTLYVELRLYYDAKMLHYKAGIFAHRKRGEGGEK